MKIKPCAAALDDMAGDRKEYCFTIARHSFVSGQLQERMTN
jgi:hypothetical protein